MMYPEHGPLAAPVADKGCPGGRRAWPKRSQRLMLEQEGTSMPIRRSFATETTGSETTVQKCHWHV